MAAISWKNAVSGDWSTGTLWTGNVAPGAADAVTIAIAGAYDVTVSTAHAAHTLVLNDANGTLEVQNTLTMGGALTVTNGTLRLDSGGVLNNGTVGSLVVNAGTFTFGDGSTIKGGSVKIAGGTFNANGGTLSASKVLGPLNLVTPGASLTVVGGLTATGAGGTGNGTINIKGEGAVLRVGPGSQTLNSMGINVGSDSFGSTLSQVGTAATPSTLTLGALASVNQAGTITNLTASTANAGDAIINKGLIRAVFAGGTMTIGGGGFVNQGTINVNLGDTLKLNSSSFTNSAVIAVVAGSTVSVGAGTSLVNNGTISLNGLSTLILNQAPTGSGKITAVDSTIALLGTVTVPEINMITTHAGGLVVLEGTLNNAGTTLNVGAGTGVGQVVLTGRINGGTIHDAGLGLEFVPVGGVSSFPPPTLQAVTYQGSLDLSENSASLTVVGGITVTGTGGSGPGVINLTGNNAHLTLSGSQTLDNATLRLARSSLAMSNNGTTTAVTFGPNLVIQVSAAGGGGFPSISGPSFFGDSLVNAGTIIDAIGTSGAGSFTFSGGSSFTNQGNFTVSNNAAATITGQTLSNTGVIVDSTQAALTIGQFGNVSTLSNSGSIAVSGGASLDIGALLFTNSGTVSVLAGSDLRLENGNWSNSGAGKIISNKGTVHLGGTITQATLGQITRTGGVLDIAGLLNNVGTLAVGAAATFGVLTLSGTISGGVIHDAGNGLVFNPASFGLGETLSHVTYQGAINMSQSNVAVSIRNSITLTGTAGTGVGSINLTGSASSLQIKGTQILDNAIVSLGATPIGQFGFVSPSVLGSSNSVFNGQMLTFGTGLTINHTGKMATLAGGTNSTDSLVNRGTINANFGLGTLAVTGNIFSNQKVINVGSGDLLDIQSFSFQNPGTLNVSGGTVALGANGDWISTGLVKETSGKIILKGDVTLPELASITRTGGTIDVAGLIDNTGKTLSVGGTTALGTLLLTGLIENGVVKDAGGGLLFTADDGTLDNVTYRGKLDLSAANSRLVVLDGITVQTAGGALPGSIDVTGSGSTLTLQGDQTLNNASISIGAAGGQAGLLVRSLSSFPAIPANVTLGPALTIQQVGTGSFVGLDTAFETHTLTNQGVINLGVSGGHVTLGTSQSSFINSGSITVSNGDSLGISALNISNSGKINVLTGATLSIGALGNQPFINTGTISETNATIILNGTLSLADLTSLTRSGGAITIASGAIADLGGGTLNVGGTTALGAVQVFGTIQNGVVRDADPGLVFQGNSAAIQNVNYRGTIDLSQAASIVTDLGGVTFAGIGGVGRGTMLLTGAGSRMSVVGSQTLDNLNISIGNSSFSASVLSAVQGLGSVFGGAANLTLGASTTVSETGTTAINGSITADTFGGGGTITNLGSINAAASGGTLTVGALAFQGNTSVFANKAKVTVSNGDDLVIQAASFSNTGTVTATTGGIVDVGSRFPVNGVPLTTFSSTGVLSENGGTINLNGAVSLANFAQITRAPNNTSGVIAVNGTADLGGGTLIVGGTTALGALLVTGTIQNGTLIDLDDSNTYTSGFSSAATFINDTIRGIIDESRANSKLTIINNQGFSNATNTGKLNDVLTGAGAVQSWAGTQTANNLKMLFGAAGLQAAQLMTVTSGGSPSTPGVLTLGPTVEVDVNGNAFLSGGFHSNGVFNVLPGANLNDTGSGFTVGGAFTQTGGSATFNPFGGFAIDPTGVVNVTGGVLNFPGLSTLPVNNGHVNVSGSGLIGLGNTSIPFINLINQTGGGGVDLNGNLPLGGATFFPNGPGTTLHVVNVDGDANINGGTVKSDGNNFTFAPLLGSSSSSSGGVHIPFDNAQFNNDIIQGIINLAQENGYLALNNNTYTGVGGVGPGLLNLSGDNARAGVGGAVDNLNILGGNPDPAGNTIFVAVPSNGGSGVATFGASTKVFNDNGNLVVEIPTTPGSSLTNNGDMAGTFPGGFFTVSGGPFINNVGGEVRSDIGAVQIDSTDITNNGDFSVGSDPNNALRVFAPIAGSGTITFTAATGKLVIDMQQGATVSNTIEGFTGSDIIEITGGAILAGSLSSYNQPTGVFTLKDSGGVARGTLKFKPGSAHTFTVTNDGHKTTITDPPSGGGASSSSVAAMSLPAPAFINPAASVDASGGNATLLLPAAGQPEEVISGFAFGNGDVLDLRHALASSAWNGDLTDLAGFVTATAGGGGTTLGVDPAGHGAGSAVALLSGVNTTLAELQAQKAFVFS